MCLVAILLVGTLTAVADSVSITGGTSQAPTATYETGTEEGGETPISFNLSGNSDSDNSSLGTCTMNPAGTSPQSNVMDEPQVLIPPEQPRAYSASISPTSLGSNPPGTPPRTPPYYPSPPVEPEPPVTPVPPVVPEPATLLIIGLAMGGLPFVRRRK
jgi:hypothetical protein